MTDPKPPKHLCREGRAEFRRIVDELRRRDLLDLSRLAAVEGYAFAFQRWRQAQRDIAAAGEGGPTRAMLEALNLHHRHLREFARDIGLPVGVQVRNRPAPEQPAGPDDGDAADDWHRAANRALGLLQ
jgi:P27 family predicted phage terminase small subunit